jgi:hypothetical protein
MDAAPDITHAEPPLSVEALVDACVADAPTPSDPAAFPTLLEIVLSAAAAAVVIGLASASWASGSLIPLLWGVDLAFHEFGHMVTFWAPWSVTAAAGSIFQVAVPLGLAAYAYFARRNTGLAAILLAWAGCSARNVAVYIADAPYQRLALWGGEGVLHDWAQLLAGRQMQYAGAIASAVEVLAWLLIAAGLVLAVGPVAVRVQAAWARQRREAALEARRGSLPVREPHGPIG